VQAIKTVKQKYAPTPEILRLMKDFRKMVNEAIRLALTENLTARFAINKRTYHLFAIYPYISNFRITAANVACGIVSNYRKSLRKNKGIKKPYALQEFAKSFGESIKIQGNNLRISITPKNFVYIPLSPHTLAVISGFTVRSVTLTACTMSLAFSKETVVTEPTGLIGLDRNLDNVTTANLNGKTTVYDLSKATEIKHRYREVKRHFRRNDARIKKQIFGKYGKLQRDRVNQILHQTSKVIVEDAKASNSGIVMENLTGIRRLYRKGNGQGKDYRARLNGWSFYELQRQIDYKALWAGVKVIYVHAAKTSSRCAICGSKISECTQRKVWCGNCMRLLDRDENAALNIVKKGLIGMPDGLASEAMVKESSKGVILLVDASQVQS
jgi:putative transposase